MVGRRTRARCLMLVCAAVLAPTCASHAPVPVAAGVIELVVLDTQGWPVPNAVVSSADGSYVAVATTGGMRLTVTGPMRLIAWRAGFAPSAITWCAPGPCEMVLYRMGRSN